MEGSSVGSKSRPWYNQKARGDSDGIWEEWGIREDKDSFKQEDLDKPSLLELELNRAGSLGSHLEDGDSKESKTDTGQCGLTGLWVSTGQGAGQDLNICCCEIGGGEGSCRILFQDSLPGTGASVRLLRFKSTRHSWSAPYRTGVVQGPVAMARQVRETPAEMRKGSAKCLPQSHRSISQSTHLIEPTGWSSRTGCHCL
ncbi:cation channel sperm-associated protein subunit zeta isoform X1 [Neovison vison]|uniref:cation channel sperm-associated protein subunit zeta isoform X1 n=1 Tax=Neovison vison TaxID=452646 RepID=UPI001CF07FF1|nr:cation channel sperm-associated protein subunit zeta isoform X1 [Neogale vison]